MQDITVNLYFTHVFLIEYRRIHWVLHFAKFLDELRHFWEIMRRGGAESTSPPIDYITYKSPWTVGLKANGVWLLLETYLYLIILGRELFLLPCFKFWVLGNHIWLQNIRFCVFYPFWPIFCSFLAFWGHFNLTIVQYISMIDPLK